MNGWPLLSLLLVLPLLTAVIQGVLPERWCRGLTAAGMGLTLVLTTLILFGFAPDGARFQYIERQPWIAGLGVHYQVGVDGLSVLFLPATALLFLGALVAAWNAVSEARRLYLALLLLLQSATLGIFCALDTVLFFVFWELTLLPLYFLLARWGATPEAPRIAARYVLIMLAGGVPLLLAFILLAVSQPAAGFDLLALLDANWSRSTQLAVFVLLLAGFACKLPVVPLHTWLPQFALAAPGSLTALILGLKVGAYGLVRFALPLAPQVAQDLHWLLAGLGTLGLLYGAVGMLAQSNLRVALAYGSICHVGLAVLGLSAFTAQAAQGAISLLLSFSVATGGAFLLLEFLRQRTGSTDLRSLGGVAGSMPLLARGFLICGLAGVGMPGTSSFPGEFMLVIAALHSHAGAGLAALFALSIAAGAFLSLYRRAMLGPVTQSCVRQAHDLRPRELVVLVALIVMVVGIGVYPGPWMEIVRPAAEAWAAGLAGR